MVRPLSRRHEECTYRESGIRLAPHVLGLQMGNACGLLRVQMGWLLADCSLRFSLPGREVWVLFSLFDFRPIYTR
jgi:hypothetical protein